MKNATKATVGAAVATGAAAAAAYYLYGTENAKQHRKELATWAKKAEQEIVREAKKIKNTALTDAAIGGVIAEVARRYGAAKNIDEKDVKAFMSSVQKGFKDAKGRALKAAKEAHATMKAKAASKQKVVAKKVVKAVKTVKKAAKSVGKSAGKK